MLTWHPVFNKDLFGPYLKLVLTKTIIIKKIKKTIKKLIFLKINNK
jgi:hypothetical protein